MMTADRNNKSNDVLKKLSDGKTLCSEMNNASSNTNFLFMRRHDAMILHLESTKQSLVAQNQRAQNEMKKHLEKYVQRKRIIMRLVSSSPPPPSSSSSSSSSSSPLLSSSSVSSLSSSSLSSSPSSSSLSSAQPHSVGYHVLPSSTINLFVRYYTCHFDGPSCKTIQKSTLSLSVPYPFYVASCDMMFLSISFHYMSNESCQSFS